VQPGDTVLDLGSGGGKICYIAAQVVGPTGRVIGVDMNDDMLALARGYQPEMAQRLGYDNVTFHKARIQDLQLNLEELDRVLAAEPVQTSSDWLRLESQAARLRETAPLIPDNSIDVVVSNCVLNLVRNDDRRKLFAEIFRVLKRGGRAVISDIVSDETVPPELKKDPRLWSGCLSGAFREDEFLQAFEEAGFYGMEILDRQSRPWETIEGLEFRSLTVRAWKGKQGPCLDRNQAVIYRGPWKKVIDDDGHELRRGERMAVCDKTFQIYSRAPYAGQIVPVPPVTEVPLETAGPFDCSVDAVRDPRITKQSIPGLTVLADGACCEPGACC
jgi:ubiquinone/menaquinone biosynthesis C-methylase UbiE